MDRRVERANNGKHIDKHKSGNLKKLQLINALMREVAVLLLDEPTAALEKNCHSVLMSWVDLFLGQVIVTSHEPDIFLNHGFHEQSLLND